MPTTHTAKIDVTAIDSRRNSSTGLSRMPGYNPSSALINRKPVAIGQKQALRFNPVLMPAYRKPYRATAITAKSKARSRTINGPLVQTCCAR